MPTILKTKNSVTTTVVPTTLQQGELAVNITDKKVWVGNAATTPVQLLGDGGSGNFTSIAFGAGTVSAPSITFTGDTNTGIYSPAADTIAFTEGGVESMRVTSDGRLGIGTTTPETNVQVTSSSFSIIRMTAANNNVAGIDFGDPDDTDIGRIRYENTDNSMVLITNNTEAIRINSSSNVGIGTSSPSAKLEVAAAGTGELRVTGSSNGFQIYTDGSNTTLGTYTNIPLVFRTNTTERMRILANGDVGIGTTSPSARLGVVGAGGASLFVDFSAGGNTIYDATNHIFRSNSGGAERMRIDSAGNVGIGTTSPAARLEVHVAGVAGKFVATNGNNNQLGFSNASNGAYHFLMGSKGVDTLQFSNSAGVERMQIDSSGNLLVGTTSAYSGDSVGGTNTINSGTGSTVIYTTTTSANALSVMAQSASYDAAGGGMLYLGCRRSASSAYGFAGWYSDSNAGLDREFQFRGDGNGYADGTWNNNGADYAEYFESATGQVILTGSTVVLENNKVRLATVTDSPDDVIGVVRPKEPSKASMVVGNTAWNKWADKYLTDDFDRYIMEDHNVVEWTDEEGKPQSYESHNIPTNVVVPENAVIKTHDENGIKFQHYKLNPAWNSDVEYVNRESRDEWLIIGLVGQVKVLKGQLMGSRWVKMRDVSANVEEWFIR
jgi:hypothetical protein